MIFISILLYSGICIECPEKPIDYLDLPTSPQSGHKYYSCNKEYGYDQQIWMTNSILSIYHCSFRNIVAIYNRDSLGIIKIKIDDSISNAINGNVNIEFCSFEICYGAILIDSNDQSIEFNIYNCTFVKCQAMKGAAVIDFKSANGIINNCYFLNCLTTDSTSGYISFNPPKIEGNDQVFKVINNVFEHSNQNSYAFLSIVNDNCRINFSNNKAIMPELEIKIYIISYPNNADINSWIFNDNCVKPFRPDTITNTNNQKIVDSFAECQNDGVVCPPILIPNSKKYESHCYEEQNDKVIDIISENKLISLFSCSFTRVKSNDNNKGGAVSISLNYVFDDVYLPFFVYNCSFNQCSSFEGGAIFINSIESYVSRAFEIQECKFTSNKCKNDLDNGVTFGGAIFINSQINNFEISNCEFEANEASNGGAIYYSTSSSSSSSFYTKELLDDDVCALCVKDCKFRKNIAFISGASICAMIKNVEPKGAFEIINCDFVENNADENGGAIMLDFDTSRIKYQKFSFLVSKCTFSSNVATTKGGAVCISIAKNEPPKPIEIKNCIFKQNKLNSPSEIQGYGSDICYSCNSLSEKSQALESNYALQINYCNFSDTISKFKEGSIYISILSKETSRSVKINRCLFTVGSLMIHSINPSVLFHVSDCEFQGESSLFFHGITGNVENCRFNDIKNIVPIHYECNSDEKTNEEQLFKIEKCQFYQENEIYSLIFFVPKISSRFAFVDNEINIPNNKTYVFNCYSDKELEGSWRFNGNSINPDNENIINSENATTIHFYASCLKGFSCTSHRFPDYECEKNKHCSINGDEQSTISFIDISGSNFNGLKDEEGKGGAAIHVINYGVLCKNTKFIECNSEKEGGGAVYIRINKIIDSLVSFTGSTFSKCSAVYGGAVFIYSDREENFVMINNCKFNQNKAKRKNESVDDQLFEGSAMFLIIKNGDVDNCDFKNNKGVSIKISNKFEKAIRSIKDYKSSILIDNCAFKTGINSTSSIFYVQCDKNKIHIDINNCIFKGKIPKESHHIDGISIFQKEKMSNFHFNSCKFVNGIKNSINSKSIFYDESLITNKGNHKISYLLAILISTVSLSIVIVVLIINRN